MEWAIDTTGTVTRQYKPKTSIVPEYVPVKIYFKEIYKFDENGFFVGKTPIKIFGVVLPRELVEWVDETLAGLTAKDKQKYRDSLFGQVAFASMTGKNVNMDLNTKCTFRDKLGRTVGIVMNSAFSNYSSISFASPTSFERGRPVSPFSKVTAPSAARARHKNEMPNVYAFGWVQESEQVEVNFVGSIVKEELPPFHQLDIENGSSTYQIPNWKLDDLSALILAVNVC